MTSPSISLLWAAKGSSKTSQNEMVNTHHDFGPVIEGKQERYLSYYGIRRSILDGAMEIQIITAIQRLTMPLSRQR